MATDGRIELLSRVRLFSSLTRRELGAIGAACHEATVGSGRDIVREGRPTHQLFVIVSGRAMARRGGRRAGILGPGGYVGELAILDRSPAPVTVTADGDVSMLVLGRRPFTSVLDQVPGLRAKLLVALVARLREADPRSTVL